MVQKKPKGGFFQRLKTTAKVVIAFEITAVVATYGVWHSLNTRTGK